MVQCSRCLTWHDSSQPASCFIEKEYYCPDIQNCAAAMAAGSRVICRPHFDQLKNKHVAQEVTGAYNDPRRPDPTRSDPTRGRPATVSTRPDPARPDPTRTPT